MEFEWTEQLSVGNAIIDSDHKILIAMVNGAKHMIRKDDSHALSEMFDQIERRLRLHFANEEMIADAVRFPFTQNRLDHDSILRTLYHLKSVITEKMGGAGEGTAEYYSELLNDWLTNHIIKEDMQLKPVLQTYPYDFKPAGLHSEFVQPQTKSRT